MKEEQKWANRANWERNRERILGIALLLGLALIFIAPIVWAIVLLVRHGIEYKPTTKYDYWRDIPEKGVHPAVIARLENWDKPDSSQLGATIMHLAHQGTFSINR